MKKMPNIKLTEQEIMRMMIQDEYSFGSEASICLTDNPHTLYKIFKNRSGLVPMSENKEKKLIELYQMDLDHCTKPISTISCEGQLIGYEMTRDLRDVRLSSFDLSREDIVYYLKLSKKILEDFKERGIIYGDVASRNILINPHTKDLKFCDMDNVSIGELPMDLIPKDLEHYIRVRGFDDKVDAYMHNIMTLLSLQMGTDFELSLEFIRTFGQHANLILYDMKNPETFEGDYLIEYVKKRD